MSFKDELSATIHERFPDAVVNLDFKSGKKIGGFVITKEFEGRGQLERQRMVWDHLEAVWPVAKQRRIIILLTSTPAEAGLTSP